MFTPEDFELPLEKELRLRVINAEIDECTNVEALQEHLKQCAANLMKYQHLLSKSIEKHLLSDINAWIDKIEKDTKPQ
jgi:hypothetical protein